MKLYARTLLFFVSTVVFQSILTILFITGLVLKDNQRDAEKELRFEADYSYNSYNTWVLSLWKDIFQIKNDPFVSEGISKYDNEFRTSIYQYFTEFIKSAGLDAVVVKSRDSGDTYIITEKDVNFSVTDLKPLSFIKKHPYIELRVINKDVYLAAFFKLETSDELNVILLKQINSDFYEHMVSSDRSIIFFSTDTETAEKKLKETGFINSLLDSPDINMPYREVMGISIGEAKYNLAIRSIGRIYNSSGAQNLYLILLVSNKPYEQLLFRIREIVLYVSLLAGVLTIFLSVFFSNRITYSFNKLILAMHRIREGDYTVYVPVDSTKEVQRLIQGFNEMVTQLNNNKKTLDKYISEITFLKDYNEKIFHSLNTGIIVVNSDFSVEKVNSYFLKHFKFEEETILKSSIKGIHTDILDNSVLDSITDIVEGRETHWAKIKRTENRAFEIKLYPLYNMHHGDKGKCVVEIEDVSRKVELEEKIMQAEKLSSLSLLSAGVSHEINNPLGSIMTNVQNLIEEEQNDEKKESLIWIEQETKRIARIVRELLDFSSTDGRVNENTEVNQCIRDIVKIIEYGIKKENRIIFHLKLETEIFSVAISSDELKQILINLIQNSIQAIEGQGSVTISTEKDHSLKKIRIIISDTGKGMAPETIPHIFDPFYTTKKNGTGTGLGLSIVYGIIMKYSGSVDVESDEGKGTVIKLSFPIKEE